VDPALRIGHLYAEEMNIYGDRGNILSLVNRARWRGIPVTVTSVGRGQRLDPGGFDLLFWGGGQDRDQELVFKDLVGEKAAALREAVQLGAVILAVCGGYQLLGQYYVTAAGEKLAGLGLLDLFTVPGPKRNIGNVVIDVGGLGLEPATLVGFENHSGKTYLGSGLKPLGRVRKGTGNNGEDGTEGVATANIFGTYLHGSLLPKNPHFTDHLLKLALQKQGWQADLKPLDDREEIAAHRAMVARLAA
jgi:CobQ-like glutamine amidotransferase family enzyme